MARCGSLLGSRPILRVSPVLLSLPAACDPYRAWPDAESVFPYVYTPETGLEAYEEVRFETETWTPEEDPEELAGYIIKSQLHRAGAPKEVLEHFATMPARVPDGGGTTLSFAGDVMWIGENWSEFASPAASLFDGLRVANLETPISPLASTEPGALGIYAFNAPTSMLDGLPFDLLQLNNNHSVDAGDEGLLATVEEVERRGFTHTGVGRHAEQDGVAFLSYTWGLNVRDVTPSRDLFVVPFGHVGEPLC